MESWCLSVTHRCGHLKIQTSVKIIRATKWVNHCVHKESSKTTARSLGQKHIHGWLLQSSQQYILFFLMGNMFIFHGHLLTLVHSTTFAFQPSSALLTCFSGCVWNRSVLAAGLPVIAEGQRWSLKEDDEQEGRKQREERERQRETDWESKRWLYRS